jgi:S-phase kinase-associated protein 1
MSEEIITLVSVDGIRQQVPIGMRNVSGLVNNILEDSSSTEEIPLEQVKATILEKIVEFCGHWSFTEKEPIKKPIPSDNIADFLVEWDA